MWTQEWSDIPSRSAWTWAMYQRARTWSSPLTASRKVSSLRLPLVGALTRASATASFGGLRCGPSGSGAGIRSSSLPSAGSSVTRLTLAAALGAYPQTGQGLEPDWA